jgi:hypothetical protein
MKTTEKKHFTLFQNERERTNARIKIVEHTSIWWQLVRSILYVGKWENSIVTTTHDVVKLFSQFSDKVQTRWTRKQRWMAINNLTWKRKNQRESVKIVEMALDVLHFSEQRGEHLKNSQLILQFMVSLNLHFKTLFYMFF